MDIKAFRRMQQNLYSDLSKIGALSHSLNEEVSKKVGERGENRSFFPFRTHNYFFLKWHCSNLSKDQKFVLAVTRDFLSLEQRGFVLTLISFPFSFFILL